MSGLTPRPALSLFGLTPETPKKRAVRAGPWGPTGELNLRPNSGSSQKLCGKSAEETRGLHRDSPRPRLQRTLHPAPPPRARLEVEPGAAVGSVCDRLQPWGSQRHPGPHEQVHTLLRKGGDGLIPLCAQAALETCSAVAQTLRGCCRLPGDRTPWSSYAERPVPSVVLAKRRLAHSFITGINSKPVL